MWFYITVFSISILLSWLSSRLDNKKIGNLIKILNFLFLVLISGLRYGIGTDYNKVYLPFFIELKNNAIKNRMRSFEIGYVLINKIVIFLGGNFTWVCLIMSFLTIFFLYKGLNNYKNKSSFTLGLFFYLIMYYQKSFNLMRQMLAVSIVFFAIKFLKKDNFKYIILVILASLFQRTVLIMLIIPLVQKIYENKKYLVLQISSFLLMVLAILNFGKIGVFLEKLNMEYYSYYFNENVSTGITINYFIRILPVILLGLIAYKKLKEDREMLLFYNLYVVGAIFMLLGYVTSTYGERIAIYFMIYQIVLIPYLLQKICENKKNIKKMFVVSFILVINVYMWYNDFILNGREETIPYISIFDNQKQGGFN